jgi:hypothetical protein
MPQNPVESPPPKSFQQPNDWGKAIAPVLSGLILTFGVAVRLVQYGSNRSLWADEAKLALNLIHRSYGELLQPLDHNQAAPPIFLLLEKLAISLFGQGEYALRLVPLLAGIASLFLFDVIAKRYLSPVARWGAIALFAAMPGLIYYTSELKQYSTDVASALLMMWVLFPLREERLSLRQMLGLGLVGAIAPWFSYPVVFVMAGLELVYLIPYLIVKIQQRQALRLYRRLGMYLAWLTSFAVFYWTSLRSITGNETLEMSWEDDFPASLLDVDWLFYSFKHFFFRPLGLTGITQGLAIALFLLGCYHLLRHSPLRFWQWTSPIWVTLIAAYLHQYPFHERLILFLAPCVLFVMAAGIDIIKETGRSPVRWGFGILASLCVLFPVLQSSTIFYHPYAEEAIKPVLEYVQTHQEPGDIIYVPQKSQYQFTYYAERYGYQAGDYILGVNDLDQTDGDEFSAEEQRRYQADLDQLRGNARVWVILSDVQFREEFQLIRAYLNDIGKRLDQFSVPDTSSAVYLYDLR